jgi:hypothetical protein
MSEHFEHNVGDHEDPVPASTWLVGAIGAVLLIVIVFGLTALYYNAYLEEADTKLVQKPTFDLQRYTERQRQHFVVEEKWVEREVGENRIRAKVIPLDQAMDEVIKLYGRN